MVDDFCEWAFDCEFDRERCPEGYCERKAYNDLTYEEIPLEEALNCIFILWRTVHDEMIIHRKPFPVIDITQYLFQCIMCLYNYLESFKEEKEEKEEEGEILW